MASDGEDDYLSDKFLLESVAAGTSSKPITYAERRRQAQRQSEIKNVQNRKKSRKEREALLEAEREDARRLREEAEEEAYRLDRQRTVVRANPVPEWLRTRRC